MFNGFFAVQYSTAQHSTAESQSRLCTPSRAVGGAHAMCLVGQTAVSMYCAKPIVNRLGSAQPPSNITVQYCTAVATVGDKVVLAVAQCASGLSGLDFGRFGHPSVQPSALQQRCARLTLLRPPEPCSHELAAYDQSGVSVQDIVSAGRCKLDPGIFTSRKGTALDYGCEEASGREKDWLS